MQNFNLSGFGRFFYAKTYLAHALLNLSENGKIFDRRPIKPYLSPTELYHAQATTQPEITPKIKPTANPADEADPVAYSGL